MLTSSGIGKILVCAPSNAAIDEIIVRLQRNPIFKGMKYISALIQI